MPDYEFGEPWEGLLLGEQGDTPAIAIWTADGQLVADWRGTDARYIEEGCFIDPEHVSRILACVNVCAGVPAESLEKLGVGGLRKMLLDVVEKIAGTMEQKGEPT